MGCANDNAPPGCTWFEPSGRGLLIPQTQWEIPDILCIRHIIAGLTEVHLHHMTSCDTLKRGLKFHYEPALDMFEG